jgi:hypothetical protein
VDGRFCLTVRLPKQPRINGHDARLVDAWPLDEPLSVVLEADPEVQ